MFLAFTVFFSFFLTAILNFDKLYVFKFIEAEISLFLKILLFFIELISFFIRPFSLGIRLFTNMLSGHILLHIFASFFIYVTRNYSYLLIIPIFICLSVFLLEFFIAFIQSYVFYVLTVIYLKDMYILHDYNKKTMWENFKSFFINIAKNVPVFTPQNCLYHPWIWIIYIFFIIFVAYWVLKFYAYIYVHYVLEITEADSIYKVILIKIIQYITFAVLSALVIWLLYMLIVGLCVLLSNAL